MWTFVPLRALEKFFLVQVDSPGQRHILVPDGRRENERALLGDV
jgi:hypothetical protein